MNHPTKLTVYQDKLRATERQSPIAILVQAFLEWHDAPESDTKQVYPRMGRIYCDCYRDHYFVLGAIWDTRDAAVKGSRLNYLAATLNKRLHGGNGNER